MTLNEHVYAICCRPEIDNDVIAGRNVKIVEGYVVVNFEIASFSSFRDLNAICSRSAEVADDVIPGEDVEILAVLRLCKFVNCYLQRFSINYK